MTFHVDNAFMPAQPQQQTPQGIVNLLTGVQDYQAKQAQSQAYAAAIDPVTGAFDQNKYNAALRSGSPAGMWGAGAAMEQAGRASYALGTGTQEQVAAQRAQLGQVAQWLAPIANASTFQDRAALQAQLDLAHKSGAMTDQIYQEGQNIINQMGPNDDGRKVAQSLLYMNLSADKQLVGSLNQYGWHNIGGADVPVQENPLKPNYGQQAGPGITRTVGPEFAQQPVDITMPNGNVLPNVPWNVAQAIQRDPSLLPKFYPQYEAPSGPLQFNQHGGGGGSSGPVTNSNFQNNGRYPTGNQGGGNQGGPTPPPSPTDTVIGRDPQGRPIVSSNVPPAATPPGAVTQQELGGSSTGVGLGRPAAPGTAPAQPPAVTQPGPVVPYQPPGQRAAVAQPTSTAAPVWAQPMPQSVTMIPGLHMGEQPTPDQMKTEGGKWALSTANQQQVQQAAIDAQNVRIPLLEDIKAQFARGATTGEGAQANTVIRSGLQRLGLIRDVPASGAPTLAEQQAATEQFQHDASLLADSQMRNLGNPTDARQELAAFETPSQRVSRYGNQGMVSVLEGNEYAARIQSDAWQKAAAAGWDARYYRTWQSQYFNSTDPTTGGRFDPRVFWIANMTPRDQRNYVNKMGPAEFSQLQRNAQYAQNQGWISTGPQWSMGTGYR